MSVEITLEQLKGLPKGTTITALRPETGATLTGPLGPVSPDAAIVGGVYVSKFDWELYVDEDALLPGTVVTDWRSLVAGDKVWVKTKTGAVYEGTLRSSGTGGLMISSPSYILVTNGSAGRFATIVAQVRLIERAPETITVRKDDVEAALFAVGPDGMEQAAIDRLREEIK